MVIRWSGCWTRPCLAQRSTLWRQRSVSNIRETANMVWMPTSTVDDTKDPPEVPGQNSLGRTTSPDWLPSRPPGPRAPHLQLVLIHPLVLFSRPAFRPALVGTLVVRSATHHAHGAAAAPAPMDASGLATAIAPLSPGKPLLPKHMTPGPRDSPPPHSSIGGVTLPQGSSANPAGPPFRSLVQSVLALERA